MMESSCKDFFVGTWVCFDWEMWSFTCLCKLFWVDVVGVLGIVKTPPTEAPLVVSGDKCWFGCVPELFNVVPMESCPIVFSIDFDKFNCAVLLVGSIDVVSCTLVE